MADTKEEPNLDAFHVYWEDVDRVGKNSASYWEIVHDLLSFND